MIWGERENLIFPQVLEVFVAAEYCSKFWQRSSCFEWQNLSLFRNECFFPQEQFTCVSYPLVVISINVIALFAHKYQEFKM